MILFSMRGILGIIFLIIFCTLGSIIYISVARENSIHDKINQYKLMQAYPDLHINGNELSMSFLPQDKDDISECEIKCLEKQECVAINYYKANPQQNQLAQCWLFQDINDRTNLDQNTCCTLAVKNLQNIKVLNLKKRCALNAVK